jgi:hypothetical protein
VLATVLLGALGACGGTSAGDDVTWSFPDNVGVDVAWGGKETVKPADVATAEGGPGARPDALPDGLDAASSELDAPPPAEPGPEGVEPSSDASEPTPDVVSDTGLDPGPGEPDAVEILPDVPDPVDTADPAPDVPPPPDNVECTLAAHCDDQKPCTVDSCLPGGTCQHAKAADNAPCEDGNVCTTGDYCLAGLCFQGAVLDCHDGNDCTTDACVPGLGCKATPKTGGTCNDGNACTGNDTCAGGVCQPGPIDLCPICGDDKCGEPYETCEDCPADCGACSETACADGVDEDWDGATDCGDADCGATEPCIETSCADSVDNDADGATDCADSQCAVADACLPTACQGGPVLTCGGSYDGDPTKNHFSGYSCGSFSAGSSDVVHRILVPAGVGSLTAEMDADDTDDDLDLYVLKQSCLPSACVASDTSSGWSESLTWSVAPGEVYFIVIEEYSVSTWGDYSLTITCD